MDPKPSRRLEEIDWQATEIGEISLRRRVLPAMGEDVYEVKLGDEFLMSSLFVEGEVRLAELALAELDGSDLSVVVGGLGLGYTAAAVLDDPRVASLAVVDAVAPVIDWHRRGLVPLGQRLTEDPRTTLVHGDFFALVRGSELVPEPVDAVVVDIDHSPRHVLNPQNASLYTPEGMALVARHLRPGGVFALWSNDPPDEEFLAVLGTAFPDGRAEVVVFDNPLQGTTSSNTVYLGRVPS